MDRKLARAELIDRLLSELESNLVGTGSDAEFAKRFAQGTLRRVDNKYLFKHRLTTLGAQLADSAMWVRSCMSEDELVVRAFKPTTADNGYELEGQIIETLMPDQPFIFDTLKLFMDRKSIRVQNSLNVILPAHRTAEGHVFMLAKRSPESVNYSYTRWFVKWSDEADSEALIAEVKRALELSRSMVRDFQSMTGAVKEAAATFDALAHDESNTSTADAAEVRDLLNWLIEDHFVFMGISVYDAKDGTVSIRPEAGLGAMRGRSRPSGPATDKVVAFLERATGPTWPIARVQKSSEDSLVHRSGKVDEIIVRMFNEQGRLKGGLCIHGLFTFKGLG